MSFTGHLCSDAQFRTLNNGKSVLNMNVAVNSGYGDYKRTLFIKVQQWGEGGKNVQPYLKKGCLIGGCGELSRNEWDSNTDGTKHVDFVVDVRNIQLLSSKGASSDTSDTPSDTSDTPTSETIF